MKDLLEMIITNICTHPDDVEILVAQDGNYEVYTISVHPDDMGRVIGKSGKVIKAIRSIAHIVGIRNDARYRVNVAEVGEEMEDGSNESQDQLMDEPAAIDEDTVVFQQDEESAADSEGEDQVEIGSDLIADAIESTEEE